MRQVINSALTALRVTLGPHFRSADNRNLVLVFGGRVGRLILGLASSALLARGLGLEGLSVFSVVSAVMAIGTTVADFGLSNSAIRHIAGDLVGQPEHARETAGTYVRFKLLGGLLVIGLVLVLSRTTRF